MIRCVSYSYTLPRIILPELQLGSLCATSPAKELLSAKANFSTDGTKTLANGERALSLFIPAFLGVESFGCTSWTKPLLFGFWIIVCSPVETFIKFLSMSQSESLPPWDDIIELGLEIRADILTDDDSLVVLIVDPPITLLIHWGCCVRLFTWVSAVKISNLLLLTLVMHVSKFFMSPCTVRIFTTFFGIKPPAQVPISVV